MSSHSRVLALLVPVLAVIAAEGDPAPAPAPAAKPAAVDDGTLNNLDLRLTLGGGGELRQAKNEDTEVETDYGEGTGGTVAIHLIYLRARPGGVGFAVGGGFFAHSYEGEPDGGGPTSSVEAAGVDVYAAFVWRPTRNWHLELPAVVLSGGSATVDTEGGEESDSGGYARLPPSSAPTTPSISACSLAWISVRAVSARRSKMRTPTRSTLSPAVAATST